jgi:hypothetical protein
VSALDYTDLSGFTVMPLALGQGNCPRCGLFFQQLLKHRCQDLGPAPMCGCGCGEPVRCNQCGVWSRWRPGHWRRVR